MEIMIVIALIGIGAAIAIPSFTSMLPGMRLNGAARMVASDLMAARMNAVKQNNQFKVFFDSPSANQYQILDDDDNDGVADTGEAITTRNIQSQYPDVTLSASSDPLFFPRGTGPNPSCIITITSSADGQSKLVKAHLTGRVNIE